jgi:steroid 5-alpha reductase family enzyme
MWSLFLTTLGISLGIQLLFFIIATFKKSDVLIDFSYGIAFTIIALYLSNLQPKVELWLAILTCMILAWSIRLTTYLFYRFSVMKKDSRFDGIRENTFRFFQFWMFQGLVTWVIMSMVVVITASQLPHKISSVSFFGLGVWLTGLIIESIADYQKFKFKLLPQNYGNWVTTGLWRYSRHPNYFGEILVWWGIFIYLSPALVGWGWISIISPISITFLLIGVTGIPILEKKYQKQYADSAEFQTYLRNTRLLLPWPKTTSSNNRVG